MRLTYASFVSPLLVSGLLLVGCGTRPDVPRPLEKWEVIPELTIGGAEEGPAAFSDIRGLAVDDQGRILVLDYATQQIEMFDSTGQHLRTIGRKGMGPGELNDANGMLRGPDGIYWVNDPNSNRVTQFDAEGKFLRTIPLAINGYGYIWEAWFERDGVLFESIDIRQDTTFHERIRRYREGGAVIDTIDSPTPCEGLVARRTQKDNFIFEYAGGSTVMGIPFSPRALQIFDHRGGAWCGMTSTYTLKRVGFAPGDTVTISGTRAAGPVTAAERDSVIAEIMKPLRKLGAHEADWSRIPATKPIIASVITDDSGRVWVRPVLAGPGETWDIFAVDGTALVEAHSAVQISPWIPPVFRGDRVYAITRDSNDVASVVRARIRRSS